MRFQRRATAFLAALILLAVAGAAWAAPYRTTLSNGLTVVIEEERSAPVVAIQVWVRVGGADEVDVEAGISHVFEHMLFKGTETRGVGEIASMVESVGGDINAYTTFDSTVYHITIPSRHFATGIEALGDAVQRSRFDSDELSKELQVVLEEIRKNEDSPGRALYKSLLSTAYSAHPYGRPVIGSVDTVEKFTREDMLRFFRKWYVPNNMTVVITGDVERNSALDAVKKEFASFRKGKTPARKRAVEPEQKAVRTDIVAQKIVEAHLGTAFHIPALKDKDTYALDVLALILGGGQSSRLYKRLKVEDSLVHGVSAYPMTLKDPGLFFITATLETANSAKALEAAAEEIRKLAAQGPTLSELERAKLGIESDFVYSRETMSGLASKLGYYETSLGDLGYEARYLDGIRNVSAADVQRVAAKYFTPENMTVSAVVPETEKESAGAALLKEAALKGFAVPVASADDGASEKTSKVRLDNGMTLIVKEVRSNPTVAFYAAFPGGLRFESAAGNGVGSFTAGMLTRGTNRLSREELAREVEEMAGSVGGFSGWNSTGASAKFLSRFFDRGLTIFTDVLTNPSFTEEEIERYRKEVLAAIKRQEDYLPGYTFKLLYRTLYSAHPYGMPAIGTPETVASFSRRDLVEHHERFFVPERMVLTIVGDVNANYAIDRVKAAFRDLKRTAAPLPAPPAEKRQDSIRTASEDKDKAQTNIAIGFLAPRIGDEDSYAFKVAAEVLSGMGGRLFLNLRDRQSLAYAVSAVAREGVDPGVFAVYIACAPEKKNEAVDGLLTELKAITEKAVTAEELNRAKNSLIGGYEIGLQEVSSQAANMTNNELYGLGYAFDREFPAKIEAVTSEDVLNAARKYITPGAYTISVVGPGANGGKPGGGKD